LFRRAKVALAAAVLVAVTGTSTQADPGTDTVQTRGAQIAAVPVLDWQPGCFEGGIECTRARVPLDYDDPSGPQVSLRLARLPASDPAKRIGTLFVNPGGPGNSGIDFVLLAARDVLSDRLRSRFDIVSFDPRGVARSEPVRCYPSTGAEDPYEDLPAFPLTPRQERGTIIANAEYAAACVESEPTMTRHTSTANVARDLDLLRRAVGDDRLTFAGFSYGTYVAATYANMFPDRVRAIWADGVVDPVAWATGRRGTGTEVPFSTRLGSGASSAATMDAFLRACDRAGRRCGFAGGDTQAKFDRLLDRLRRGPVRDEDGEVRFRYGDAVAGWLGPMYFQDAWPSLGDQLQHLYQLTAPDSTARQRTRLLRGLEEQPGAAQPTGNATDGFNAVACVDTTNPTDPEAWPRAADAADRRSAPFGRLWTWESGRCAAWAARDTDRYLGPFDRRTSAPVLVVGNKLDPATPYEGAVALNRVLSRSRLLTVDYAGHTSLGQSRCVTRKVDAYLINGSLPPRGTVCKSDRQPFERLSAQHREAVRDLGRVLSGR
jgi:pimeloyl-ACP methyl ester carboxylesterase